MVKSIFTKRVHNELPYKTSIPETLAQNNTNRWVSVNFVRNGAVHQLTGSQISSVGMISLQSTLHVFLFDFFVNPFMHNVPKWSDII